MPRVITVQNVYTGQKYDLCQKHFGGGHAFGDTQVQHGLRGQGCEVCDECDRLRRLDRSIAPASRRTEWRYGND